MVKGRWSPAEDKILIDGYKRNQRNKLIAAALQRDVESVHNRIHILRKNGLLAGTTKRNRGYARVGKAFSVALTDGMLTGLRNLSKRDGVGISTLIRKFVAEGLARL